MFAINDGRHGQDAVLVVVNDLQPNMFKWNVLNDAVRLSEWSNDTTYRVHRGVINNICVWLDVFACRVRTIPIQQLLGIVVFDVLHQRDKLYIFRWERLA